jgi:hypothetical protein
VHTHRNTQLPTTCPPIPKIPVPPRTDNQNCLLSALPLLHHTAPRCLRHLHLRRRLSNAGAQVRRAIILPPRHAHPLCANNIPLLCFRLLPRNLRLPALELRGTHRPYARTADPVRCPISRSLLPPPYNAHFLQATSRSSLLGQEEPSRKQYRSYLRELAQRVQVLERPHRNGRLRLESKVHHLRLPQLALPQDKQVSIL